MVWCGVVGCGVCVYNPGGHLVSAVMFYQFYSWSQGFSFEPGNRLTVSKPSNPSICLPRSCSYKGHSCCFYLVIWICCIKQRGQMNASDLRLDAQDHRNHTWGWRNYKRIFRVKKRNEVAQKVASPGMCRNIPVKAKAMRRIITEP